tara:strand:- start:2087 stop:4150 length:2064 start_codon:yes stop_codon:yes gene_type:complete
METFDDFDIDLLASPVKVIQGHPTYKDRFMLVDPISKLDSAGLKQTLLNIGCPHGEQDDGFLAYNCHLSVKNERILFNAIKFESACKYLLLEHIVATGVSWRSALSWVVGLAIDRNGVAVNETIKGTRHQLKKRTISITCSHELKCMFVRSLTAYKVLKVSRSQGPYALKDGCWPGSDELQRVRSKCMMELPRDRWLEFVVGQIWTDSPLAILDVMNEMIVSLEKEEKPMVKEDFDSWLEIPPGLFDSPKKDKKRKVVQADEFVKKMKYEEEKQHSAYVAKEDEDETEPSLTPSDPDSIIQNEIPVWLNEEFQDLCAEPVEIATSVKETFFFRVFKFWMKMPRLSPDEKSVRVAANELYRRYGQDAMFFVYDWHCATQERLKVYESKKMIENYGENPGDRIIYIEKLPPWKVFPKQLRYEEVTMNIVITNVDGIHDDLTLLGQRIHNRYSYGLLYSGDRPVGDPLEMPVGDPPEEAEETSIDVRERRTGSRELEYKGMHFQGKKVLAEYEKAVADRKSKVKVKKQTWFEVLFWSVAIYAMDLYLPYRDGSNEQFLIGFFIGVAVVLRILFHSPHYFWTVVTIVYIRWVDTKRFAFVPGEIYATVALQMFCMERKWAMMIPVTGFAAYCYFTGKHWSILIHYLVTLTTSWKAHRVDDGAKNILVSPYKDSVLFVVALFYTCLGGFSFG